MIGRQIRQIRLAQGRTLAEVAAGAGLTKGRLSQIENGKTNPPVATLTRIAGALGVTVPSLLEEGEKTGTVYQKAGEGPVTVTEKGYAFLTMAAGRAGKRM